MNPAWVPLILGLASSIGLGCGIIAGLQRRDRRRQKRSVALILVDQLRMMCDASDEMKYGTISTGTLREYLDRIEPLL